ncbi:RING-like domain-containing protein [Colletotrichum graminicola]|uniref:Non-structural maintenance of chromosomes element 1 homolog n=1 Tax=Colletotrichum graminicola (strain M1.001 / M2 / FGSC 10212) TaxID=645133 RepID=E3QA06_COLGM|nr:RING-like domain-containing protein [Colletotrichum graminicola M1.001]EFQ27694.1 RING-like domain-containing protein [Colletotrichum graminicola M1.001]WDK11629.1 RING-like domain-containing protein [Colletotrichum graminicola]
MNIVPPHYNDGNRAFLQAFLARGTLTFEEAQTILAEIFTIEAEDGEPVATEQVTQQDFESFLEAAAEAVSFFDYEIRSAVHQVSKKRVYALVNTASDPMTQLATTYNAEQIAFIKRLLDAMFETYNSPRMELMCITEMQAIKLARPPRQQNNNRNDVDEDGAPTQTQSSADKGLKHSEVEDMLMNLMNQGWLEKSRNGFYSLSPRALLELRAWLIDSYNDPDAAAQEWQRIKFCEACKGIVTVGQRCGEVDCNARLHHICADAYWRTQRSHKCPRCSRDWDDEHYVGEEAQTSTEAYKRGRRRSGGRKSNVADEDVHENGEEEDEDEA